MYDGTTLREALKAREKYVIESLMKKHKGDIPLVAKQLGISRTTVYDLLNKYKFRIETLK